MKKYQFIFTIVVIFLYLLNSYYDYESVRKEGKAFLSDININIINMNEKLAIKNELIGESNFTFWDMKESNILKNRKEALLLSQQIDDSNISKKEKRINQKKRIICLEQQCWEFLGVVFINGENVVTLLSKDKLNKLETFRMGDKLLENLVITVISSNMMLVEDIKKKKKFKLKLFDVDMEQYLPKKKIKESNEKKI